MTSSSNTPILHHGDATDAYAKWRESGTPDTIVSDGAYGIGGFPGDPKRASELKGWYSPHVEAWSEHATAHTALWFWNTEVGWANVHGLLEDHGWKYVQTCTWDKGKGHIAGNVNSKTIRRFPVVTEICVLYQREPEFKEVASADGMMNVQQWMRSEWKRAGLPFSKANEACGVKNAASRKWFASDHNFYLPSRDMMEKLISYANEHGKKLADGEPAYFAGMDTSTEKAWEQYRYHWNHTHGVTNVWNEPALRSSERIKLPGGKSIHLNQKPLSLSKRIVQATTPEQGIVWDPFGGTGSITLAAMESGFKAFYAEKSKKFYDVAFERLGQLNIPGL